MESKTLRTQATQSWLRHAEWKVGTICICPWEGKRDENRREGKVWEKSWKDRWWAQGESRSYWKNPSDEVGKRPCSVARYVIEGCMSLPAMTPPSSNFKPPFGDSHCLVRVLSFVCVWSIGLRKMPNLTPDPTHICIAASGWAKRQEWEGEMASRGAFTLPGCSKKSRWGLWASSGKDGEVGACRNQTSEGRKDPSAMWFPCCLWYGLSPSQLLAQESVRDRFPCSLGVGAS